MALRDRYNESLLEYNKKGPRRTYCELENSLPYPQVIIHRELLTYMCDYITS